MTCDIQNAYLTASCREKIWTYAGPELGSERCQPMIIKKALYGLKSSGATSWAHLAETLHDICFKPTKADPNVWIRPAFKLDRTEYYEYIMFYVDDILSVSHDAQIYFTIFTGRIQTKGRQNRAPRHVSVRIIGDNAGRRQ